jgi:cephalosporin hydroxylase
MSDSVSDPVAAFEAEKRETISGYKNDEAFQDVSNAWMTQAFRKRYMYHFSWMGRPIIQLPTDMVAVGELIWDVKPDLVIETGIAHGGSLIFSASMLALLDVCESVQSGAMFDPKAPKRKVLGIDIDIRAHNRSLIEQHPMSNRIEMIEGSSISPETIQRVQAVAKQYKRVLVCLDSMHTHEHVLAELEGYAPLTSKGSYCVVFDTVIENLPDDMFPNRPWSVGDNPTTAIREYMKILKDQGRKGMDGGPLNFEVDPLTNEKLMISAAPGGYLRRI